MIITHLRLVRLGQDFASLNPSLGQDLASLNPSLGQDLASLNPTFNARKKVKNSRKNVKTDQLASVTQVLTKTCQTCETFLRIAQY